MNKKIVGSREAYEKNPCDVNVCVSYKGLEEIEKIDYESVSLAPYTTSRKINEIIERLNLLIRLKNGEINNGPTS